LVNDIVMVHDGHFSVLGADTAIGPANAAVAMTPKRTRPAAVEAINLFIGFFPLLDFVRTS
jgi:hypothetical protein